MASLSLDGRGRAAKRPRSSLAYGGAGGSRAQGAQVVAWRAGVASSRAGAKHPRDILPVLLKCLEVHAADCESGSTGSAGRGAASATAGARSEDTPQPEYGGSLTPRGSAASEIVDECVRHCSRGGGVSSSDPIALSLLCAVQSRPAAFASGPVFRVVLAALNSRRARARPAGGISASGNGVAPQSVGSIPSASPSMPRRSALQQQNAARKEGGASVQEGAEPISLQVLAGVIIHEALRRSLDLWPVEVVEAYARDAASLRLWVGDSTLASFVGEICDSLKGLGRQRFGVHGSRTLSAARQAFATVVEEEVQRGAAKSSGVSGSDRSAVTALLAVSAGFPSARALALRHMTRWLASPLAAHAARLLQSIVHAVAAGDMLRRDAGDDRQLAPDAHAVVDALLRVRVGAAVSGGGGSSGGLQAATALSDAIIKLTASKNEAVGDALRRRCWRLLCLRTTGDGEDARVANSNASSERSRDIDSSARTTSAAVDAAHRNFGITLLRRLAAQPVPDSHATPALAEAARRKRNSHDLASLVSELLLERTGEDMSCAMRVVGAVAAALPMSSHLSLIDLCGSLTAVRFPNTVRSHDADRRRRFWLRGVVGAVVASMLSRAQESATSKAAEQVDVRNLPKAQLTSTGSVFAAGAARTTARRRSASFAGDIPGDISTGSTSARATLERTKLSASPTSAGDSSAPPHIAAARRSPGHLPTGDVVERHAGGKLPGNGQIGAAVAAVPPADKSGEFVWQLVGVDAAGTLLDDESSAATVAALRSDVSSALPCEIACVQAGCVRWLLDVVVPVCSADSDDETSIADCLLRHVLLMGPASKLCAPPLLDDAATSVVGLRPVPGVVREATKAVPLVAAVVHDLQGGCSVGAFGRDTALSAVHTLVSRAAAASASSVGALINAGRTVDVDCDGAGSGTAVGSSGVASLRPLRVPPGEPSERFLQSVQRLGRSTPSPPDSSGSVSREWRASIVCAVAASIAPATVGAAVWSTRPNQVASLLLRVTTENFESAAHAYRRAVWSDSIPGAVLEVLAKSSARLQLGRLPRRCRDPDFLGAAIQETIHSDTGNAPHSEKAASKIYTDESSDAASASWQVLARRFCRQPVQPDACGTRVAVGSLTTPCRWLGFMLAADPAVTGTLPARMVVTLLQLAGGTGTAQTSLLMARLRRVIGVTHSRASAAGSNAGQVLAALLAGAAASSPVTRNYFRALLRDLLWPVRSSGASDGVVWASDDAPWLSALAKLDVLAAPAARRTAVLALQRAAVAETDPATAAALIVAIARISRKESSGQTSEEGAQRHCGVLVEWPTSVSALAGHLLEFRGPLARATLGETIVNEEVAAALLQSCRCLAEVGNGAQLPALQKLEINAACAFAARCIVLQSAGSAAKELRTVLVRAAAGLPSARKLPLDEHHRAALDGLLSATSSESVAVDASRRAPSVPFLGHPLSLGSGACSSGLDPPSSANLCSPEGTAPTTWSPKPEQPDCELALVVKELRVAGSRPCVSAVTLCPSMPPIGRAVDQLACSHGAAARTVCLEQLPTEASCGSAAVRRLVAHCANRDVQDTREATLEEDRGAASLRRALAESGSAATTAEKRPHAVSAARKACLSDPWGSTLLLPALSAALPRIDGNISQINDSGATAALQAGAQILLCFAENDCCPAEVSTCALPLWDVLLAASKAAAGDGLAPLLSDITYLMYTAISRGLVWQLLEVCSCSHISLGRALNGISRRYGSSVSLASAVAVTLLQRCKGGDNSVPPARTAMKRITEDLAGPPFSSSDVLAAARGLEPDSETLESTIDALSRLSETAAGVLPPFRDALCRVLVHARSSVQDVALQLLAKLCSAGSAVDTQCVASAFVRTCELAPSPPVLHAAPVFFSYCSHGQADRMARRIRAIALTSSHDLVCVAQDVIKTLRAHPSCTQAIARVLQVSTTDRIDNKGV